MHALPRQSCQLQPQLLPSITNLNTVCLPSLPPVRSYCRNLPATYTRQDVGEMFLPFGTVLEIRL